MISRTQRDSRVFKLVPAQLSYQQHADQCKLIIKLPEFGASLIKIINVHEYKNLKVKEHYFINFQMK